MRISYHGQARQIGMWIRLGVLTLMAIALCSAEDAPVAGTWRGESLCAARGTSCKDETVVYYIRAIPDRPTAITIRADKFVNGQPVTMGTSEWTYDRDRATLEWRTSGRTWVLSIHGSRIDGTLTLPDQTVFRKMTLKNDD